MSPHRPFGSDRDASGAWQIIDGSWPSTPSIPPVDGSGTITTRVGVDVDALTKTTSVDRGLRPRVVPPDDPEAGFPSDRVFGPAVYGESAWGWTPSPRPLPPTAIGGTVYHGPAPPVGAVPGDLWIDDGDGGTIRIWAGSEWAVLVVDTTPLVT